MLYKSITGRGLMAMAFLAVFAVTLLLTCVAASAGPAAGVTVATEAASLKIDAAYKAAHDTDPHLPLTVEQKNALQVKERQLADAYSRATGLTLTADAAASLGAAALATSVPAEWGVAADQQPQQRSYWCGPATLVEALIQCGTPNVSQATAAAWSGATSGGTAWSGGPTRTGYPMADVMNDHQSRNHYVPQSLSYSPTSSEINTYKSRLVDDIHRVYAPVIGDAYEVPNGTYHLVGHPSDHMICHWFDIYGYASSGATTCYEDSVHGCPTSIISWAGGVPAYSRQASNQIAIICGGRGYIW